MVEVVVADDHAVFVDALVSALDGPDWTVVGTADSVTGAVASVRSHRPDICLLDRHFADGDGIDMIDAVRAAAERTKVLVLTADGDAVGMREALDRGAVGYINKMCGLTVLLDALRAVMNGEIAVELAAGRSRAGEWSEAHRLASYLTAREWECLRMLVNGAHTKAMAKALGVSPATVRTHVQSVLTKLGVHSRLEAASFAIRHSLLDDRRRLIS